MCWAVWAVRRLRQLTGAVFGSQSTYLEQLSPNRYFTVRLGQWWQDGGPNNQIDAERRATWRSWRYDTRVLMLVSNPRSFLDRRCRGRSTASASDSDVHSLRYRPWLADIEVYHYGSSPPWYIPGDGHEVCEEHRWA